MVTVHQRMVGISLGAMKASSRTIIYVRHAESAANAGEITKPNNDIPLSKAGRTAALELAQTLPAEPSLVLVSRALRTRQTAEPYCRRIGIEPIVEPLLDEFQIICPSLIAGMDGRQRRAIVDPLWIDPDPERRMGRGADTFTEFQERVRLFIDHRLDSLPHGTVVFGHGIWCGMLQWLLEGRQADSPKAMAAFRLYQQQLQMKNGQIVEFVRPTTP